MNDAETINTIMKITKLFQYAGIITIKSELPQYLIIFTVFHRHKKVHGQEFTGGTLSK